jgi:hypothetical protein
MFFDAKFAQAIESVGEAFMAQMQGAAQAGGGEMGLGGPGELPPGEEPMPEAEAGAEGAEETPEGEKAEGEEVPEEDEEESALAITPPGKRDEDLYKRKRGWYKRKKKDALGRPKPTKTSKSKGKWYSPVTYDRRDMGARRRHYKGQWAAEVGTAAERNLKKGYLELAGLGKNATYVGENTIYDNEERRLLEMNKQIEDLIKEMESTDASETQ